MPGADWLPMLSRIDDPVAEDIWRGLHKTARIVVGRPQPLPEGAPARWYCPLIIEGHLPGIKPVLGMSPVTALVNAMSLVRRFFEENPEIVPPLTNDT